MLTIDMLRQNGTLAGLTDAQFNAIAEMSKNDENTVIGTRIGELHGQYDNDILGITGIQKNQGENFPEQAGYCSFGNCSDRVCFRRLLSGLWAGDKGIRSPKL